MKPNAFVVCVEFDDFLEVTLRRNFDHFGQVVVITSPVDRGTAECVHRFSRGRHPSDTAWLYPTDAFYRDGCAFNKGAALEEARAAFKPKGWLAVWDADVLLPQRVDFGQIEPGNVYGTNRRLLEKPTVDRIDGAWDCDLPVAMVDHAWDERRVRLGGHFLLFHLDDPVLFTPPIFPVRWRHAGGYDSDFVAKWPHLQQVNLGWEVLHLGKPNQDWMGRVSPRLDHRPVPGAADRAQAMARMRGERERHGYEKEIV